MEHRAIDDYVALGRERKTTSGPTATRRMQTQQDTPRGQETYAQRTWLVEAPIGWIKRILCLRQFGMRGLHSVQGEWNLVCLALNVKRPHRHVRHALWFPAVRVPPALGRPPVSALEAFLHTFCGADS